VSTHFEIAILRRMTEWTRALQDGDDPEELAATLAADGMSENQVEQFITLAAETVDLAESVEDGALSQGRALQSIVKLGYDAAIAARLLDAARAGVRESRDGE
jgi:hypothetical protein